MAYTSWAARFPAGCPENRTWQKTSLARTGELLPVNLEPDGAHTFHTHAPGMSKHHRSRTLRKRRESNQTKRPCDSGEPQGLEILRNLNSALRFTSAINALDRRTAKYRPLGMASAQSARVCRHGPRLAVSRDHRWTPFESRQPLPEHHQYTPRFGYVKPGIWTIRRPPGPYRLSRGCHRQRVCERLLPPRPEREVFPSVVPQERYTVGNSAGHKELMRGAVTPLVPTAESQGNSNICTCMLSIDI